MELGQPRKTHPRQSNNRNLQMGHFFHGLHIGTGYQQVHRLEGGDNRGQVSVQFS